MKEKNTNKGITLIALVITIIVMLILVAVTISMAVNGGLFEYARNAGTRTNEAVADEQELASGKLEIDGKWYANIDDYLENKPTFYAEKWDEKAAPHDVFIWQSNDPNDEGYGVVVGYRVNLDNYPTLRFPSRCTKIKVDESRVDAIATEDLTTDQIRSFTSNVKEIELPETVVEIGELAFGKDGFSGYCFTALEKITIPRSVTVLGKSAFYGCKSLTSISIPESVTSLGIGVFRECTGLTNIIIPDSVSIIENSAFECCTSLTSITLPEGLKCIDNSVLRMCSELKSIKIPNSVTKIEHRAFDGCTALTTIEIPETVNYIDEYAFVDVPHIEYHGSAEGAPWGALSYN